MIRPSLHSFLLCPTPIPLESIDLSRSPQKTEHIFLEKKSARPPTESNLDGGSVDRVISSSGRGAGQPQFLVNMQNEKSAEATDRNVRVGKK